MFKHAVEFDNAAGHTLKGHLYWPLIEPRAFVLFAHCFTCSADLKATRSIARALNREGLAVLAFDFTGLGQSEGDFADTGFSTNVGDLLAAARYLEAEHRAPGILVGHSLGGTAVLAAAPSIASARAVVTIGAPARAAHVAKLIGDARQDIEIDGEASVDIGGRPFRIKRAFLEDLERQRLPEGLRALRRALLIMHSPRDAIVSIDNAAEIFAHALHPKSFLSLDDADHLLTRERDAEYAARVLAGWASRYLDTSPVPGAAESVTVARTKAGGFLTEINAAGHALTADEPAAAGGTDAGPSPYDLLAAALASCTGMTLQMYARRKGLALDQAIVRVRHSKIHAVDCAECETQSGRVDQFERELTLEGALDATARARMAEIADRCPLHRTLLSEVSIRTTVAGE